MRAAFGLTRIFNLPARNVSNTVLKPSPILTDKTLSIVENDGGLQASDSGCQLRYLQFSLIYSDRLICIFSLLLQYACLPHPATWNGLTRIVAVFNAGSRFENLPHLHGLTHLIRRCCGISTTNYTAVNLTRHIQQMGGRLQ